MNTNLSMEHWWEDNWQRKLNYLAKKTRPSALLFTTNLKVDRPGIETGFRIGLYIIFCFTSQYKKFGRNFTNETELISETSIFVLDTRICWFASPWVCNLLYNFFHAKREREIERGGGTRYKHRISRMRFASTSREGNRLHASCSYERSYMDHVLIWLASVPSSEWLRCPFILMRR